MQTIRRSLALRTLIVFATSAVLLAPLTALAGRTCFGCASAAGSAAKESGCCGSSQGRVASTGSCCRGACDCESRHNLGTARADSRVPDRKLGCLLGGCSGECPCRISSDRPAPLREGNEPVETRVLPRHDAAPATTLVVSPVAVDSSLLDTAVLCAEPPGGQLRWHAYLSVWRN
ncbi:MAG: hypothetical protein KF688_00435 [Pirellulales bacterium]|nr:hypothetical protein [Pirellulales bacterium]